MATANRNKSQFSRASVNKNKPSIIDFSKIGGLNNHIKLLREIIIFPLLYGDLFQHFHIKAPRGVLFFGPPGTGKTLVAGALATEVNREGNGKVTFFQRKGADILDKWVGESERKLRELFDKATRCRPSVIFFDELDGLAPERSQKNDQVHCSIVATLLALMDGLDNMPGVIVIGATNRIDAIDPALRRPGRFDRELYFPLPTTTGRKEILQVHLHSWKNKPSTDFLSRLAELTSGCCGSDLQALCTESVLCCLKRIYPNISKPNIGKVPIDFDTVKVEECDFLNARMNLVPTVHRLGTCKQRRLSPFIEPLLKRQLNKIQRHLNVFLPHFTQPGKKYLVGSERYAGRLVLKGTNQQGLNTHLIPAILQSLEHLPNYILDVPSLFEKNIKKAKQNLPSILVLSRVDDWWDFIENGMHLCLTALLEDFHAGLPLLIITTCVELPDMLKEYFYKNSSIVLDLEDPNKEERELFLCPLFFDKQSMSIQTVLDKEIQVEQIQPIIKQEIEVTHCSKTAMKKNKRVYNTRNSARLRGGGVVNHEKDINLKRKSSKECTYPVKKLKTSNSYMLFQKPKTVVCYKYSHRRRNRTKTCYKVNSPNNGSPLQEMEQESKADIEKNSKEYMETLEENLKNWSNSYLEDREDYLLAKQFDSLEHTLTNLVPRVDLKRNESNTSVNVVIKQEPVSTSSIFGRNLFNYGDSKQTDKSALQTLWQRVINVTSKGLQVTQLELLYDMIKGCIYIYPNNYGNLIRALEEMLTNFEKSTPAQVKK